MCHAKFETFIRLPSGDTTYTNMELRGAIVTDVLRKVVVGSVLVMFQALREEDLRSEKRKEEMPGTALECAITESLPVHILALTLGAL